MDIFSIEVSPSIDNNNNIILNTFHIKYSYFSIRAFKQMPNGNSYSKEYELSKKHVVQMSELGISYYFTILFDFNTS